MTDTMQAIALWLIENILPEFDASFLSNLEGVQPYMLWLGYYIDFAFWSEVIFGWMLPIEIALDVPQLVFYLLGKVPNIT